ncbi:amino acid ABC transporter substrate-binding protein [Enterobacteriaceae bacterium 4M9]|nr:amino acid ABC transporter substrate-binding protein [Enterobacteriaceae bacterium 4M9]
MKLFDDKANAQGGAEAARQIVDWSADAVVGHFASAAAEAAAPWYAQHNVPLFLPAATAKHLTANSTTWRLCDNDEDYVTWLAQMPLAQERGTLAIEHDGSVHGKSVAQQLRAALKPTAGPEQAATTFFAGCFSQALEWAVNWARCAPPHAHLILSDDAFSAELVPALLARGIDVDSRQIYVAAISPQPVGETASVLASAWQQRWSATPGCYFWETLAALQVACRYPDFPAHTLLGTLHFDAQRESRPGSFILCQATRQGLQRVLTMEESL